MKLLLHKEITAVTILPAYRLARLLAREWNMEENHGRKDSPEAGWKECL